MVKILAKIYSRELQQPLDPMKEVITTIGAYEAMYAAFQALVNPGDEVGNERTNKTNTRQTMNKRQYTEKASKLKNKRANKETNSKQTNKQNVIIDMCMNNVYFCSLGNPFRAVLRALQGCGGTSGGNGALCSLNSSK